MEIRIGDRCCCCCCCRSCWRRSRRSCWLRRPRSQSSMKGAARMRLTRNVDRVHGDWQRNDLNDVDEVNEGTAKENSQIYSTRERKREKYPFSFKKGKDRWRGAFINAIQPSEITLFGIARFNCRLGLRNDERSFRLTDVYVCETNI